MSTLEEGAQSPENRPDVDADAHWLGNVYAEFAPILASATLNSPPPKKPVAYRKAQREVADEIDDEMF